MINVSYALLKSSCSHSSLYL